MNRIERRRTSWWMLAILSVAAWMGAAGPVLRAQTSSAAPAPATPRTPWGDPDLQGIWNNATNTPLERPDEYADRARLTEEEAREQLDEAFARRDAPPRAGDPGTYNAFWSDTDRQVFNTRTSLVIDPSDGRIPALTPEAQQRETARAAVRFQRGPADSYIDRNRWERCLARGLPMAPGPYNNSYEIIQTPGYVAISMEMIHDTRIIPLDDRPHLPSSIRQWLGDSRARWEGETLVVETVNFVDELDGGEYLPSHRGAMFQHRGPGDTLTIVERFTRTDEDTIVYQFTLDDPKTYTRPWTAEVLMARTDEPLYEYACHEGNYGLVNILRGARADEAAGNPNLGGGSWTAGR